jgi:uncharacterized protein (DUF1684 family)
MKQRLLLSLPLLAFALAACDRGTSPAQVAQDRQEQALQRAFEKETRDWRVQRLQRLTKPDGWLSLVGMHWLEPGETRVGSGAANGTRVAVGPDHIGIVAVSKDGQVRFTPEPDAGILVDGQPATGSVVLATDADTTREPTVIGFNKGDASFIVIRRGDRYALRVREALAPTRTGFPGLDYFPMDRSFRLRAKFTAKPAGSKIEIVNILSMVEKMDNPGTLTFEKDGKSYTVETIDEGDHRLFLVFSDRTSGHESYPASRFVYAEYPGKDGYTTLDFNQAYNPPCAFTPYSTCPLPPNQNRIDLAIRAGERKPIKPALAR